MSLLFRTKTFLCVSLLWETKSVNKRRTDTGILSYCTKLKEITLQTRTSPASNEKISGSMAFNFGQNSTFEFCLYFWHSMLQFYSLYLHLQFNIQVSNFSTPLGSYIDIKGTEKAVKENS